MKKFVKPKTYRKTIRGEPYSNPENDIWTPPILQVIKEEGVKAVVYTGYGEGAIITSLFNELKASGIAIIYRDINPTPENTRLAEKAGADILLQQVLMKVAHCLAPRLAPFRSCR